MREDKNYSEQVGDAKLCVDCEHHCKNQYEFAGPILETHMGERLRDHKHYCIALGTRRRCLVTGREIWHDVGLCESGRRDDRCGPDAKLFKLKTKGTTIAGMMVELSELREFKKKAQSIPVLPTGDDQPGVPVGHDPVTIDLGGKHDSPEEPISE